MDLLSWNIRFQLQGRASNSSGANNDLGEPMMPLRSGSKLSIHYNEITCREDITQLRQQMDLLMKQMATIKNQQLEVLESLGGSFGNEFSSGDSDMNLNIFTPSNPNNEMSLMVMIVMMILLF